MKKQPASAKKHRFDRHTFEVKHGSTLDLDKIPTRASKEQLVKDAADEALGQDVAALQSAQLQLYAGSRNSVLVILQGMDASGKDGAIRHVMSGVNPLGCRAYAFRAPNELELKHHFLWRPAAFLPERGMISLFNRSYYEEVLVVRVHPQFLEPQNLPQLKGKKASDLKRETLDRLWKQRYREINAFERSLVLNGTIVIKFFLHISRDEQKERLLDRIRKPESNWKFNPRDLEERGLWPQYMQAFQDALSQTSTPWAPWYIIPGDNKWFARAAIADIIVARLEELDLSYPEVTEEQRRHYQQLGEQLEAE